MRIFLNGLVAGFVLQLAIGPVFFFILNLALQKSILDALFAVLAVTIVDYLYIFLSLFGVGKLLNKSKQKRILGYFAALILIVFGILLIKNHVFVNPANLETNFLISNNLWMSFSSAFVLTITNPLTIIFWTGLFTAKAIERNYSQNQLFIYGFGAGLATFLFLAIAVYLIGLIKFILPLFLIKMLNFVVGIILICYGIWGLGIFKE